MCDNYSRGIAVESRWKALATSRSGLAWEGVSSSMRARHRNPANPNAYQGLARIDVKIRKKKVVIFEERY